MEKKNIAGVNIRGNLFHYDEDMMQLVKNHHETRGAIPKKELANQELAYHERLYQYAIMNGFKVTPAGSLTNISWLEYDTVLNDLFNDHLNQINKYRELA